VSYELFFDKQPTGRTHQVNAGGTIQTQQIMGADGEPEQEYVLGAIVDGHAVPLQTFSVGYVEHMASRPDTELSGDTSSSSSTSDAGAGGSAAPAAPAEGQGQPAAPAAPAEGQPAAAPAEGQAAPAAGEGQAQPPADQAQG